MLLQAATGAAARLRCRHERPDQPLSHEVLERARAYVRVDQRIVAALPELGEAIRSFEPVPGPAGRASPMVGRAALNEPQEATVRVRLSHGKVTGVYALCAAQIALSREGRAQLGGVHYRTQPAILLAQFARTADTPGIGDEMLRHADTSARPRCSTSVRPPSRLTRRSRHRRDGAAALRLSRFRAAGAGNPGYAGNG